MHYCQFYRMSWSKWRHPISFAKCVNTVIIAALLFFWANRSGRRRAQGIYSSIPTWTNFEARYQCVHHKIIICWRLEFVRSLLPQFAWLLWHCRDFVFSEHPSLNPIFPSYTSRRMSFVRCYLISTLSEFCKQSNITRRKTCIFN